MSFPLRESRPGNPAPSPLRARASEVEAGAVTARGVARGTAGGGGARGGGGASGPALPRAAAMFSSGRVLHSLYPESAGVISVLVLPFAGCLRPFLPCFPPRRAGRPVG